MATCWIYTYNDTWSFPNSLITIAGTCLGLYISFCFSFLVFFFFIQSSNLWFTILLGWADMLQFLKDSVQYVMNKASAIKSSATATCDFVQGNLFVYTTAITNGGIVFGYFPTVRHTGIVSQGHSYPEEIFLKTWSEIWTYDWWAEF